jgi:ribokinase
MSVRALVVGSLVMDLAFRIPRFPGPGEVVRAESFEVYRGGKGYDQAVALARLGAQVAMIGALGHDAYGDDFLAALDREGVDRSRMVRLHGVRTTVAVPLVMPDGDVGFIQARGANWELRPEHCTDLGHCELVLLQGEVPIDTSLAVARRVRAAGGLVLLNPAPVHDITPELLAAADVICPNEVEARALAGPGGSTLEPIELARALAGSRIAVVTLGERGAAYAHGTETGLVPPPQVNAIDATGAGDSFCAALGLALAEGQPLRDAVVFACAAGAHATTAAGAEPGLPTRAQVEALLQANKNGRERG